MSDIEKLFRILVDIFEKACLPSLFLGIIVTGIVLYVEWHKLKNNRRLKMSNDCITYLEDILEKLATHTTWLSDIQNSIDELLLEAPPPTPPFPPQADTITVVVKPPLIKNQIPLRAVRKLNDAGYPTWKIYLDPSGKRICPKRGKELRVYGSIVRGDGRTNAYRLIPDQVVDGRKIPTPSTAYILLGHTK